ncbi:MAG: hypothetical protein FJX78_06740 [Armatimonadetes bacterium]|nr:hypothetical protein [Armatimonadota bacterium]
MSDFTLILHSHLPWVLGHGRWPHGSDWLNEIVLGCYLPLLEGADALLADGVSPAWTIGLSPVLCEQLSHPAFRREFGAFAANRIAHLEDDRAAFARTGDDDGVTLTDFWRAEMRRHLDRFDKANGNVVTALRALEERGAIEIMTCAATHGYLPLLGRDASIDLQLRVAVATHERHFGRSPRGIWLPESAYRPRYGWSLPTGPHRRETRGVRPGIEEWIADRGLRYFVTDLHMAQDGTPMSTQHLAE